MIEVPKSFLSQPRWWHGGHEWLASLPDRVSDQCRRWALHLDGPPMHGSNALVVPVRRGPDPLVLRLTPPQDDVAAEITALRFWDGRGTVQLFEADPARGATLLERLDGSRSLQHVSLDQALWAIGTMMRRLAVPAPESARATTAIAASRETSFVADWERLGRPFSQPVLELALQCAARLSLARPGTDGEPAVNGDLHFEQVLAGSREKWLCVDPILLRGDIEYDLARVLWHRLDEMTDDTGVCSAFDTVVTAADLDGGRARTWVLFRSVDYWLWGLRHGLTEDPVRCARLVKVFA